MTLGVLRQLVGQTRQGDNVGNEFAYLVIDDDEVGSLERVIGVGRGGELVTVLGRLEGWLG